MDPVETSALLRNEYVTLKVIVMERVYTHTRKHTYLCTVKASTQHLQETHHVLRIVLIEVGLFVDHHDRACRKLIAGWGVSSIWNQ